MSQTATEAIRNIALVGPTGAGKTTLAESLLHAAQAVSTPGSVERGTTVSDADLQEQAFHHSIAASVLGMDWQGTRLNVIDTPGYPDFLGQCLTALPAVETAAVVINAQAGIESMAREMMERTAAQGLCRAVIVNRIDAEEANLEDLLGAVRETFGAECLALNLPAEGASTVADCFFEPAGSSDFSSVAAMHETLVDQVVEVDEKLMALFLEQGEALSAEQLHGAFERALREGHLIPVCFTSAKTGAGVQALLEVCRRLLPNPAEGNPPPFLRDDGQGSRAFPIVPEAEAHALAHVFKVEHDPFAGKLSVFRVHQGVVRREGRLFVGDGSKPFKVNNLFRLQGRERKEIDCCVAGDIAAVAKVDAIGFDDVLHDSHDEDHIHMRPVTLPTPVFGRALRARQHGDEHKLSEVLAKLVQEDPGLRVEHDAAANETVLRGLGELHLSMTLEKMQQRFNVAVDASVPSVPYRETVTVRAEGHHRHKKQTGGAGQFGEVSLRVEPLPRGAGFEFVNAIHGGAIPASLVPAVEKGVRQVMDSGAVSGHPMQDVRVTVYDGKTHPVDSKEVAFTVAGRKAFLDAVRNAKPVILEPYVHMTIDAPGASLGDITGDLSARRGRIQDTVYQAERVVVRAVAPMAGLEDYSSKLKSMTAGEGRFSLEPSHYEPVPPAVQEQLTAAYRPQAEEA